MIFIGRSTIPVNLQAKIISNVKPALYPREVLTPFRNHAHITHTHRVYSCGKESETKRSAAAAPSALHVIIGGGVAQAGDESSTRSRQGQNVPRQTIQRKRDGERRGSSSSSAAPPSRRRLSIVGGRRHFTLSSERDRERTYIDREREATTSRRRRRVRVAE